MVAAWLNRPPLASVHTAALPAAPSKSGEGKHFLLERMVDRDRQCAVPIHLGHLPQKFSPMIRPPLQDVVLPLMDHLVRQRADDLVPAILRTGQQGLRRGRDRRISRCADLRKTFAAQDERGPARLTNMPTEEVSRLLQTRSIGGSAPLKCRALRSCQIAVSCCEFRGAFVRRAIVMLSQLFGDRGDEQG